MLASAAEVVNKEKRGEVNDIRDRIEREREKERKKEKEGERGEEY